jgi:hypothetical protein
VLEDVLAPGVCHWTDFDGATRAGVRPAPSTPPRVALLDYDAASKWADIDADDPTNLLGATIPADPIRQTPALVINELFAWASDEGFRYRAAVSTVQSSEPSRLAAALRDLVRGFVPELPALELRRARVTAQGNDGRVSVQQVNRDGEVSDFGRTENNGGAVRLYAGTAGASAELDLRGDQKPETILAFAHADNSDPIAFLAPPVGQPGHVPFRSFYEAADTLRMVGNSAGRVKVGAAPTKAVALAPDLVTYLQASEACWAAVDTVLEGLVGPTYTPLKTARLNAAGNISAIAATRLEAK